MKIKKLLSTISIITLAACSFGTKPQPTPLPESEPTNVSFPLTITDHRGQQLTLTSPAQKIVTFPMPAPFLLTTIAGSPDFIIGMHPASLDAVKEGIMQTIYPSLLEKQTNFVATGFEPNIEELLKLEPDLIIQWANKGTNILDPIDQSGLATLGLNYGSQEDLESWMAIFGQITNQPQRAQDLIEYHHQTLKDIQRLTSTLSPDDNPKVLYLSPVDNLRAYGDGTYNHEYFKWTGATNVASEVEGYNPVTMEEIIAWDPDIIYIGNFSDHVPEDILQSKLDGQDFSSIKAVKNNQVFKVPLGGYRWDPPNQESPLMWQWLLTIQHPDLVDFDLRQNVKDFYQTWYQYQLTEEEIDSILRCDLNPTTQVCQK